MIVTQIPGATSFAGTGLSEIGGRVLRFMASTRLSRQTKPGYGSMAPTTLAQCFIKVVILESTTDLWEFAEGTLRSQYRSIGPHSQQKVFRSVGLSG